MENKKGQDFNDLGKEITKEIFDKGGKPYLIDEPIPLKGGFRKIRKNIDNFQWEWFPKIIQERIEFAHRNVQAPMEMCMQSVLSVITLCTQNLVKVRDYRGNYLPVTNYFITIADSGERKSSVDSDVMKPVYKWISEEKGFYEEELKKWRLDKKLYDAKLRAALNKKEGQQEALRDLGYEPEKPRNPYILLSDVSFEGIYDHFKNGYPFGGLMTTEGGLFLSSYGMRTDSKVAMLAGLCSIWDGKGIHKTRVKDFGTVGIDEVFLSMHLLVQKDVMNTFVKDGLSVGQGFAARLLVSKPNSMLGERKLIEKIETSELVNEFNDRVECLLDLSKKREDFVFLDWDEDIKEFYETAYYEIENHIKKGQCYHNYRSFAAKLCEIGLRLGGAIEYFSNPEARELTIESAYVGMNLAKYYLVEWIRNIVDYDIEDEKINAAENLLDWLYTRWKEPAISIADILIYCKRKGLRNKVDVLQAIQILQDNNWLYSINGSITIKGEVRKKAWKVVKKNK